MDLSIIIVSYNTKELLKQTVDSVLNTSVGIEYEIIVVDNASSDGSVGMLNDNYKGITVIENSDNVGFSKANNIGIKKSTGRYVLLLNSDTVVKENCFRDCLKYMEEHKDVGALGPRISLLDGRLDRACKRGFPTPEASLYYFLKLDKKYPQSEKYGRYNMTYLSEHETNEVDCLVGAFMMVRKEVIDKIGLLDEEFFMYGEDIDWCYRIKEAGYKNIYYPVAEIIHYKGASSKKRKYMTIYEFHRAMILFYKKHYIQKYNLLVTIGVYSGVGLKLVLALTRNFFKRRS